MAKQDKPKKPTLEGLANDVFALTKQVETLSVQLETVMDKIGAKPEVSVAIKTEKNKLTKPTDPVSVKGKKYRFTVPTIRWKGGSVLTKAIVENPEMFEDLLNKLAANAPGALVEV